MTTPTTITAAARGRRLGALRIGSWVLYDFANTVYAATVTYLFIPRLSGWSDVLVLTASAVAMVAAGLLVPAIGALCDATGRARSFLAVATLTCVAAMASLSAEAPLARTMATFMIAQISFQSALVAYNALLSSVAPKARTGTVSGLGTAVGYLGTVAILVFAMVSERARSDPDFAIRSGAVLFLASALPCLAFVRDRRFARPVGFSPGVVREAFRQLGRTVRSLPRHRPLLLFLIGNFLLLDVVNTAVILFGKILKDQFSELKVAGELELFGLAFAPDPDMTGFLIVMGLLLNLLAMAAGFILGPVSDRTSGLRVMRWSGACLIAALLGAIAFGGGSANGYVFAVVLPGAFGLAGLWTAGRKVVVQLAPPERVGEFFGLYGLTTKLSVLGMATFSLLQKWQGIEVALGAQIVPAAVGLALLALVRLPAGQAGGR